MNYLYSSTLPVLALWLVYRPFATKLDKVKLVLFGAFSFITPFILVFHIKNSTEILSATNTNYTSLYQYVVQPSQHIYQENVLSHAFVFTVISVYAVIVSSLFTRWHLPITFVKPKSNYYLSAFMRQGCAFILYALAFVCRVQKRNEVLALTAIGSLWYLSGPYFIRRWKAITLSSTAITAFSYYLQPTQLALLDLFTLSLILTLTCNSFDHMDAILDVYPELVTQETSKIQDTYSTHYWSCMIRLVLLCPRETDLDPEPINDLQAVMQVASARKWQVMSLLYPSNIRPYLCFFAAFSRMYDDLIDDAPTKEEASRYLSMMRRFVKDAFRPSVDRKPLDIDWDYYRQELPSEVHMSVFRNVARMGHFLCPNAMLSLLDSLEMDILNEPKKTVEDLKYFCYLASGNFIEICTCILMYKTGNGNWAVKNSASRDEQVLHKYGTLGQALQLVNIARDIIRDSTEGRCYVPLEYMSSPESTYRILKEERKPYEYGVDKLKEMSLRILDLTESVCPEFEKDFDNLPNDCRNCQRAAFEIYWEYGTILRNDSGFPFRAKVPTLTKVKIALSCIYGLRDPTMRSIISKFKEVF